MTGCPVLFDRDNINELVNMNSNGKITVSLGVSFVDHERSESLHKYIINNIIKLFGRDRCQVVFHHTLSQNNFTKSYGQLSKLYFAQEKFSNWLRQEEINYVDISGGEKAFFNIYDESYLHVGFRVHAHLYMISQNKPSFLLAEDSRAIGMRHVLGGTIFDLLLDYRSEYNSQKFFGLKKTKKIRVDKIWSSGAVNQFINVLKSELDSPSLTLQQIRNKNNLYDDMKRFINELP